MSAVLQPRYRQNGTGLGSSPFDRHYLGNHYLFYFPPGTKMFQFSGFASRLRGILRLQRSGLPHSDTCGYNGYLLLPAAFRSLSRPSSPLRAKAFTMRSYFTFLSNQILLTFIANMSKNFLISEFRNRIHFCRSISGLSYNNEVDQEDKG